MGGGWGGRRPGRCRALRPGQRWRSGAFRSSAVSFAEVQVPLLPIIFFPLPTAGEGCVVLASDSELRRSWVRGPSRTTGRRSEEHTSELQSLMRISYAVFCLKKKHRTTHEKQMQHMHANKTNNQTESNIHHMYTNTN